MYKWKTTDNTISVIHVETLSLLFLPRPLSNHKHSKNVVSEELDADICYFNMSILIFISKIVRSLLLFALHWLLTAKGEPIDEWQFLALAIFNDFQLLCDIIAFKGRVLRLTTLR